MTATRQSHVHSYLHLNTMRTLSLADCALVTEFLLRANEYLVTDESLDNLERECKA